MVWRRRKRSLDKIINERRARVWETTSRKEGDELSSKRGLPDRTKNTRGTLWYLLTISTCLKNEKDDLVNIGSNLGIASRCRVVLVVDFPGINSLMA